MDGRQGSVYIWSALDATTKGDRLCRDIHTRHTCLLFIMVIIYIMEFARYKHIGVLAVLFLDDNRL